MAEKLSQQVLHKPMHNLSLEKPSNNWADFNWIICTFLIPWSERQFEALIGKQIVSSEPLEASSEVTLRIVGQETEL